MDKFIIARSKFQGETKLSTEYVALDSNNNIQVSDDPMTFGSYFGTKAQANEFKESYRKHLAQNAEEGITYKLRTKAASQAARDFCTESIHRLEEKAVVTDEAQAAVLESIKVAEPEQVEQPVEATVTEAKPKAAKKVKKDKKAAKKAETEQAAA